MKIFKFIILLSFLCFNTTIKAQNKLITLSHIKILKDSIKTKQLISDLNGFINAAENKNTDNQFVYPKNKVETFILVDEFKNIEKSRAFKDKHFFKPYLTNVTEIDKDLLNIKISHIGLYDSISYLRTEYNLIAHYSDNNYTFSSPLTRTTKNWKSLKINNCTFYFEEQLNTKNAKEYAKLVSLFDEKLQSKNKTLKIYCTNNLTELLKIIGVDYRLDYNGRKTGTFHATNKEEQLVIIANKDNSFDPHDLWHDRLSAVISRRLVNKPIDEACAYLYGGSWNISWKDIFKIFRNKVATDKNTDWKYYKENPKNFNDTQKEHLMVDYVVNALIVQKIEKEKGFESVWKFLNCGKFEKGNDNYYKVLEEITGITKDNYNSEVWKLITLENN